jgi:hypothetical protein
MNNRTRGLLYKAVCKIEDLIESLLLYKGYATDADFDESKHPRRPDGKFGTGGEKTKKVLTSGEKGGKLNSFPKISPTGKNQFLHGFTGRNLDKHWAGGKSDHSKQYPGVTREQYAKRALDLARSAVDGKKIFGFSTKDGAVVRYDAKENDFVKCYSDTGIATMFKPKDGFRYYLRKKREG